MNRGFVKVWRKTRDTGLNCVQLGLWTSCLLESAHKPRTVFVASQQVELQAGQFVFGRSEWARRLGLSDKTLRSALAALIKRGMISASTRASKFTVYSVVNWALYQVCEQCEGPAEGPTTGPAEGQQRASRGPHIKNIENLENGKKEDNTAPPVGVIVPKPKRKPRSASSLPFADDFATFWETYPRKVAKPNAEKAWSKLVKAGELPDMDTLLAAVANQADAKDWRTDQTFCPHPATWLNGKRWEDSVTPARGVDTSWHVYRDWSTRYLTRRRAIHPDDTPEPTQDIVDAGAQWLGEWICEDGFSEPQIKAGIVWLLENPRRCHHVKHLGDLGLYSQGVGGNLGTWCVNGAMGMPMPADPFNPGPMDGGPPRDIA